MGMIGAFLGICATLAAGPMSRQQAASEPFRDVPRDHWAYEAVENLRQMGILLGYPDGSYRGRRTVTRYESAAALDRTLGKVRPRSSSAGEQTPRLGPPGPKGPPGEPGPQGPAGPPGVRPPEIDTLQKLLGEMRVELERLRAELAAIDEKAAGLSDQKPGVKKGR